MVCSEQVSAPLAVVDLHLATPAASAGGTYLASPLTERRLKIFPDPGLGVLGRIDRAAPISDPYAAGARSGRRHQSELAEQLGLIEVEMFRGQLVAANLVTRHPAEVDVPSRGSDIARRRAHDTGVRTNEPALGGDERSFGEKARRLKTPSGNASQNTPRRPRTSPRPRIDAFGATNSASSLHGSASASRALNASTCRSTTRLGSAIRPYLLSVAVRGYSHPATVF